MINKYFPDEEITKDDLYFVCYMIEHVARKTHNTNQFIVTQIPKDSMYHLLSCAPVLYCENPKKVEDEWISEFNIADGDFYFDHVNPDLDVHIPSETKIGKVFQRLILDTLQPDEDFISGIYRVYSNPICEYINDYNTSAFYEPSYVLARAYYRGQFD